jgi:hypothetical protein
MLAQVLHRRQGQPEPASAVPQCGSPARWELHLPALVAQHTKYPDTCIWGALLVLSLYVGR